MAKKTRKPEAKSPGVSKGSGLKERLERSNINSPRESAEERLARIKTTIDRARVDTDSPGRGSPQFIVRYPNESMRAMIARLAKQNNRSINAEIIDRLQKSMTGDAIKNLEESVGEIFDRVEKLESLVSNLDDQVNHRIHED